MSFHRQKAKTDASSINYKWIPLDVQASEVGHSCDGGRPTENIPKRRKERSLLRNGTSVEDTQVLLSTAELASAIGSLWKVVGHPSAICRSRGLRRREDDDTSDYLKNTVKANYEELQVIKKMLFCDSSWFRLRLTYPMLKGNVDGFGFVSSSAMFRKRILLENKEECFSIVNICETVNTRFFSSLRCMVNRDRNIEDKDITCQTEFFKVHQRSHRFKHSVEPAINQGPLITVTSKFESPSIPSSIDLPIKDIQEPIDSCFESCEKQSISEDTVDTLTSKTLPLDSTFDDEHHSNPLLRIHDRLCIGFGRQTYALAGALSGTFVSICLHPIDTVKTVIQSRSMNQVSIFQAFASVISERGVF